jgi:hypothetical protein
MLPHCQPLSAPRLAIHESDVAVSASQAIGVSPLSWPADNRWPRLDYDFAVELGQGSKFLFRPIHRFGGFARHRDHFEDVCCYGCQPDIHLADRLCEAKDGALCRMVRLVKMPFDLIILFLSA